MVFLVGRFFGWDARVRKSRKRWDRLREKALKKDEPIKGLALKKLDEISSNLVTMEERELGRMDRARIAKDVEIALEEVKALLKSKPEEIRVQREVVPQGKV